MLGGIDGASYGPHSGVAPTPVVFDGGSVVEVLAGAVEAFVEGLVLIFEGIGNIFNSIFG